MDHHAAVFAGAGVAIFASMVGAFSALFIPLLARRARKRRGG
ncbi:hypothetical protein [Phenylobacterium sp.]|nr:hypothetical protein [Phenylobacterium sp.]